MSPKKQIDKMSNIEKITDFLRHNKVDAFWINSAIGWIRRGLAGNCHWCTELHNPKVTVDKKFHCVKKFTVQCTINTVEGHKPGTLTYTFNKGHKVTIK